MKRWKTLRWLLTTVLIPSGVLGCRDRSPDKQPDTVVEELNRIRPAAARYGLEHHIDRVLAMRTDEVMDPRPFLVLPILGDPNEQPTTLTLCLYDEDADILGVGVQEIYVTPAGDSTTLVEEYPVFAHRHATGSYDYRRVPVCLRESGQRKDATRWDRYLAGDGIEMERMNYLEYYRETLPPVWISIPDPNRVEVRLYLYDEAGNRSEPVYPVVK